MAKMIQSRYIILGAGPAGLQLGYFLQQQGCDFLILEAGEGPGTFFKTFPRHRQLISINKVNTGTDHPELNLRWDWNSLLCDDPKLRFAHYSKSYFPPADTIVNYLDDFARPLQGYIRYNTKIENVGKVDEHFELLDQHGQLYQAVAVIVATGVTKPYIPDIPGVELCEQYVDCSVDPNNYLNQRVLIIGKGNSAFETAENLMETTASIHLCSPTPVKLAWKTHFVGNVRAVNNNFLDTYQLKSQNTILDARVDTIRQDDKGFIVDFTYTHAMNEKRTVRYDRVILCTGFRFDTDIFAPGSQPERCIKDRFPAQTPEWESTNIAGLYFAGTLMQARDYRKTMSGFIHGFRYNVKALSHILMTKYESKTYPHDTLPATVKALTEHVVYRINHGSAIFQQPGFMGDMIAIDNNYAYYYNDMPLDYVRQGALGEHSAYFTISLEYGDFSRIEDPFYIERDPRPEQAHLTAYLHPIIRFYKGRNLVAERHVPEDLENVYSAEIYTNVIHNIFAECLPAAA